MSEPYKITYNKFRFPVQPKREDGTLGCRGCGGVIPNGRQTWCSKRCVRLYDPKSVIIAVKNRDKGICAACGAQTRGMDAPTFYRLATRDDPYNYRFPKAEFDHVVSFADGGLTVLENMRTLCKTPCHRERTKQWHGEREQQRRTGLQLSLL